MKPLPHHVGADCPIDQKDGYKETLTAVGFLEPTRSLGGSYFSVTRPENDSKGLISIEVVNSKTKDYLVLPTIISLNRICMEVDDLDTAIGFATAFGLELQNGALGVVTWKNGGAIKLIQTSGKKTLANTHFGFFFEDVESLLAFVDECEDETVSRVLKKATTENQKDTIVVPVTPMMSIEMLIGDSSLEKHGCSFQPIPKKIEHFRNFGNVRGRRTLTQ